MGFSLRTPLCEMLGIEVPVMVAGMGGYVGPELAAAVSNAGGLGVLGGTSVSPEVLREWIRKTKELTDKPFAVDLILPGNVDLEIPPISVLEKKIPEEHRAFIEKLGKPYANPDRADGDKAMGRTIPATETKALLEVMFEEGAPIFASGLGSPGFLMDRARAANMKVMALTGNVKNAKRLAADGVDVIIAQGHEGGAHTGRIGTMALLPQVLDAVAPLPVVAAGGIGDGRGLAASLAMGCQAVWCGSAFIPTHECLAPEWRKKAIIELNDESTVVSRSYTGKPCRSVRNEWIEAWEKGGVDTLPMPLQMLAARPALAKADPEDARIQPNMVGQIAGLLNEIKPAAQVVKEMLEGAQKELERLAAFVPQTV